MKTVVKQSKKSLINLSRIAVELTVNHYDDGSTTVDNRDESIKIGALQRIALSLENIDGTLYNIFNKMPDDSTQRYKNQVAKLSQRLRKAGLDHRPTSDNRKP